MDAREHDARLEAVASGTVQGVGFRYAVRGAAERLGLVGVAENLPDGTVRVVAEGPRTALEELVAWLGSGRTPGHVTGLDSTWGRAGGGYRGFGTG